MDLTTPNEIFSVPFPPATRADVEALEATLLPAVARRLKGPPSDELASLIDDVLADWMALALAQERQADPLAVAQLRAVAQASSETLLETVLGGPSKWTAPL